ncbi:response regulator transcription factor [Microbacterium sp.]|uniref:response regulator transcription factor n=1 Tax=Microbacterium sp. TaxID=51671 RepID=UPI0026056E2E|nr:response regulator transcription factor [Microbacterium sp.]
MAVPARTAIVDDHELIALAVRGLVDASEHLVFERHVASVADLVRPMPDADLVLLDLNLRDGSSPSENVEAVRSWGAEVLVLTSAENPYLVRDASRTAALGIVRKAAPSPVLLGAIEQAARGEMVATSEWASALDTDPLLKAAPLTSREREVLSAYASGLGAKEVGERLFVSENTVLDHLKRIRSVYQQLGRPAATKIDLYQRSVEDGLIPAPIRD